MFTQAEGMVVAKQVTINTLREATQAARAQAQRYKDQADAYEEDLGNWVNWAAKVRDQICRAMGRARTAGLTNDQWREEVEGILLQFRRYEGEQEELKGLEGLFQLLALK